MSENITHLTALRLEELAEGGLGENDARAAEAHLQTCRACTAELESYRQLFTMLEELPRFEPSASFVDSVMAQVALAPEESAAVRWVRQLVPSTKRGWVLLGTLVTAPMTPLIAVIALMLVQPLLTPATLWQWSQLRLQSMSQAGLGWALEQASALASRGWIETVYTFAQSLPGMTVAAVLGTLSIGIPLSLWTLLRLTRTPATPVTYAS